MMFKLEKDDRKTHFFIFNKPIYYRKNENGIQTTRFLCFRKKTILPEYFIEERNLLKRLEGLVKSSENQHTSEINRDKIKSQNIDKSNKKLTVIIPVFNTGEYIERCLRSVCSQSYKDLEIIIVDDASTDNSLNVAKKIQQRDGRIKIIQNSINSGSGISRNKGISLATGAYITFVDSDDYIKYENFFADCLRELKKNKSDCLITPFARERDGTIKHDKFDYNQIVSGKEACSLYLSRKLGTHSSCGKFFKSVFVKKHQFNEYGYSQDVPFVAQTLISTKNVTLFEKCGYVYFNDNSSAWRPLKLTNLHFYSSFRLLLDILVFQKQLRNNGIIINIAAFKRLWAKEHGKRIIEFLRSNDISSNAFVKEIVYIIDQIQSLITEEIPTFETLGLSGLIFNDVQIKKIEDVSFIQNLSLQADALRRLQNEDSIAIYISHLSKGGLERVASELSFVLRDLGFKVNFILDRVKDVDYEYFGKIFKANISDNKVKEILDNSKFIFDFKFKSLEGEFPIVKYILATYPEKYIATIHNTKTCKNYFEKSKQYLSNKPISCMKGILCVSEAVKKEFISEYGHAANIHTLHNFIDQYKSESNADVKLSPRLENYLLFAGRLNQTEHKGIDVLVKSFDKANLKDDIKLVLCGAGELDDSIKKAIEDSKKRSRIIVLPFEKNVFPLMKNAIALLAPSRWEGFSMVHLEALSVGTPVLSTLCGGAAEVIQPGINGFLSPVDDVDEFAKNIEKAISYAFDKQQIKNSIQNFTRRSYSLKLNYFLKESKNVVC